MTAPDSTPLPVTIRRNRSGALALELDGTLYLADGRCLPLMGREGAWDEADDVDLDEVPEPALTAVIQALVDQELRAAELADERAAKAAELATRRERERRAAASDQLAAMRRSMNRFIRAYRASIRHSAAR